MKLSPAFVAANSLSPASGDVSISPSKLVAVVSPQRRPQSEKKVYKHISVKPVIIICRLGLFLHSSNTIGVGVDYSC